MRDQIGDTGFYHWRLAWGSRAIPLGGWRSPGSPGRITELRHIVYKDADEPWRRGRERLGLMLEPDLLKENVDGEALLWAHERLLRRSERRRICW